MRVIRLFRVVLVWQTLPMLRQRFIRVLLAALIISGIAGAPLTASAIGFLSAQAEMAGMDCCPDAAKPDPCKNCPAMLVCVLKTLQGMASAEILLVGRPGYVAIFQFADIRGESLAGVPPDHPPRTLT